MACNESKPEILLQIIIMTAKIGGNSQKKVWCFCGLAMSSKIISKVQEMF